MKPGIKKSKLFLPLGIIVVAILLALYSCHTTSQNKNNTEMIDNPGLFERPANIVPVKGQFIYKSAIELASLIKNKQASSVDITKEFLAYIKNNNYKYNSLVWLREKEALDDAKKADELVSKGGNLPPLLGVPMTVKEEFWVKGSPVTLNAKMNEKFVAPEDGPIVKQLKQAGAIILGKTNVPTLLMDMQVQGEIYPTGSNPYDTSRTPGGSTGGGAAALAAGFTSLEVGSDLGGSVRVPASFCGLYGLKTTFGSINVTEGDGADTISIKKRFALNTVGPLARTPEDLELAWQVLRNTKPDNRFQHPIEWKQPVGKKFSDYHIAWTDDWQTASRLIKVGNDVKEKIKLLVDSLSKQAVDIKKYAPDTYDEMMKSYFTCLALLAGEGKSAEIRQIINNDLRVWDDGSGIIDPFYTTMNNPSDSAWAEWQIQNNKLKAKWDVFFSKFDFLIIPVTYGAAFKKCKKGSSIVEDGDTIPYFRYYPYSTILNPIECPAITIPLGLNKNGLPITVQVIGPKYSEPELLYFAKLIKHLVPGFVRPSKISN